MRAPSNGTPAKVKAIAMPTWLPTLSPCEGGFPGGVAIDVGEVITAFAALVIAPLAVTVKDVVGAIIDVEAANLFNADHV